MQLTCSPSLDEVVRGVPSVDEVAVRQDNGVDTILMSAAETTSGDCC